MEELIFSFDNYLENRKAFPDKYISYNTENTAVLSDWAAKFKRDNNVDFAFDRLKDRTTHEYFSKVHAAQVDAYSYSIKCFPPYKYMLPECLADDWLSTMDWHKKHNTRDHSLHQPLTAYIAMSLLGFGDPAKSLDTPQGPLLLVCVDAILNSPKMEYLRSHFKSIYPAFETMEIEVKERWAKNMFYETVAISALFHDMGYPWQFVNRLDDHVDLASYREFVLSNDELKSEREKEGKLLLDFIKDQLIRWPLYGYATHSEGQETNAAGVNLVEKLPKWFSDTHGFPGAIGFTSLNKKSRIYDGQLSLRDATYRFITEWAAVGIMMHDMAGVYQKDGDIKNPYLRLSLDTDPLSCIIALSDVLEEFERPKAIFDNKPADYVKVSYSFECTHTKVKVDKNNCILVTYGYKVPIDQGSEERRIKEVREYLNPINGFVDLSLCGIVGQECVIEVVP